MRIINGTFAVITVLCGLSCSQTFKLPEFNVSDLIQFEVAPLYAGSYSVYTDSMVIVRLDTPLTVDWITAEQVAWGLPVHPFTHSSGGLRSVETYRPPFHIQVKTPFLYNKDVLESVWLLNDASVNPTRELDLFESGFSWRRELWMADHYSEDSCYINRKQSVTDISPVDGVATVDILVYPDHALRFLNGELKMVTWMDLDYEFTVLVTMIVKSWFTEPCRWDIESVKIRMI
jgi:hypothetical protein